MTLQGPRLTVVVPTRNRPGSLHVLLQSLTRQTLAAQEFEVVVVDDGSEPPVAELLNLSEYGLQLRTLYRAADHGAHASRWTGLRAARGQRVLFLDDDVTADARLLEAHAAPHLGARIGLGPILYPANPRATPYFRYMGRFYDRCYHHVRRSKDLFSLGDYYVCNSSGPAGEMLAAFEGASMAFPYRMVGGEFDEGLLAQVFASRNQVPVFLPDAMLRHRDTKTLEQARAEGRISGASTARMLLEHRFPHSVAPLAQPILGTSLRAKLRRSAMRCYWAIPLPFAALASLLAMIASRGPRSLVPAWTCHVPVRLSRWEGMRQTIPSFAEFLRLLESSIPSGSDG